MIRDALISALREGFPERLFAVGSPPNAIISYHAEHPRVGDVKIWDDGAEATVEVGVINHGHFGPYPEAETPADNVRRVVEEVADFLAALFEDRVRLWLAIDGGSGGWEILDEPPTSVPPDQNVEWFLWSGPMREKGGRITTR